MRYITTLIVFFCFTKVLGQPPKLTISHITGDFYVYTTYKDLNGDMFPSNSMYLVTYDGVVLFDTPWDTTQFQPLLDSIQLKHHKKVILCIATHFHNDRTAGLEYYRQQGIKTYTTQLTDELSKAGGNKRAEFLMQTDTTFTIGEHTFQTYYPGPGHTQDNIVIWFSKEKILYGGCLVKSTEATNLGYLADANVKEWPATIKNIQATFNNPKFIITGHQNWASRKSLEHTLKLIEQYHKTPYNTSGHSASGVAEHRIAKSPGL